MKHNASLLLHCITLSSLFLVGCLSSSQIRPYPQIEAMDVLESLYHKQHQIMALQAEASMDLWITKNNERFKVDTLFMGKRGGYFRFQALSPAGDSVAIDVSCHNNHLVIHDLTNNCQQKDSCTNTTIPFIPINTAPEAMLMLAMGSIPLAHETITPLTWVPHYQAETFSLLNDMGNTIQTILVKRHNNQWDIIQSKGFDDQQNLVWQIKHTNFTSTTIAKEDMLMTFRLPEQTHIINHQQHIDLVIEWKQRLINPVLDASRFSLIPIDGLKQCQ